MCVHTHIYNALTKGISSQEARKPKMSEKEKGELVLPFGGSWYIVKPGCES
jgi:hypothetical protein